MEALLRLAPNQPEPVKRDKIRKERPFLDAIYAICPRQERSRMRSHDRNAIFAIAIQHIHGLLRRSAVHGGGGLVEKEHLWIAHQCPRYTYQLLLSAGKCSAPFAHKSHVPTRQHFKKIGKSEFLTFPYGFLRTHRKAQPDVVDQCPAEYPDILRYDTKNISPPGHGKFVPVAPVNQHLSRFGHRKTL